jgi:hypothetical protein
MEDKELHPVVKLMIARMASDPDEFSGNTTNRWGRYIDTIERYGSDEDREAIKAAMYTIRMDKAHSEALDELYNGVVSSGTAKPYVNQSQVSTVLDLAKQQRYTAEQQKYDQFRNLSNARNKQYELFNTPK